MTVNEKIELMQNVHFVLASQSKVKKLCNYTIRFRRAREFVRKQNPTVTSPFMFQFLLHDYMKNVFSFRVYKTLITYDFKSSLEIKQARFGTCSKALAILGSRGFEEMKNYQKTIL